MKSTKSCFTSRRMLSNCNEVKLVEGAKNLPEPLASIFEDDQKLDKAIASLRRHSLISNITEKGFSIHRLVRFAIRNSLSEDDRKIWASATIALVGASSDRMWHIHHEQNDETKR